jgi:hypothetical protein
VPDKHVSWSIQVICVAHLQEVARRTSTETLPSSSHFQTRPPRPGTGDPGNQKPRSQSWEASTTRMNSHYLGSRLPESILREWHSEGLQSDAGKLTTIDVVFLTASVFVIISSLLNLIVNSAAIVRLTRTLGVPTLYC